MKPKKVVVAVIIPKPMHRPRPSDVPRPENLRTMANKGAATVKAKTKPQKRSWDQAGL